MRAHHKRINLSLVNAGKMKRLVNSGKTFVLFMIKQNNDMNYEYFEGCDDKLKFDLFDVLTQHGEMFQETMGLPPKRGIQHEIEL